jgi:hypothetical protein
MSWLSPRSWTNGETVTSSMMNTLRDCLLELWKGAAVGDMEYYDSALTKARLGAPASHKILGFSVSGSSPAWEDPTVVITGRVGGDATNWYTSGSSFFTPATAKIYTGVVAVVLNNQSFATVTVTFPVAFSAIPIVIMGVPTAGLSGYFYHQDVATGSFKAGASANNGNITATFQVPWIAIGPV